jgi:hypothetical protein
MFTICAMPRHLCGEPTITELLRRDDPLLLAARKLDPNVVGFQSDSQDRCAAAYLEFVDANPDDELVSYIYSHLGHLYSDWAGGDAADKAGFVRDEVRAHGYFERAVVSHPPDQVSGLLFGARANAASLTSNPKEKVALYIELFNDLQRLRRDEVSNTYWLLRGQGESTIDAFWSLRSAIMQGIKVNTVFAAASAKDDPLTLLDEVKSSVADDEFASRASEMRESLRKQNPWLERNAAAARWARVRAIVVGSVVFLGGAASAWVLSGMSRNRSRTRA